MAIRLAPIATLAWQQGSRSKPFMQKEVGESQRRHRCIFHPLVGVFATSLQFHPISNKKMKALLSDLSNVRLHQKLIVEQVASNFTGVGEEVQKVHLRWKLNKYKSRAKRLSCFFKNTDRLAIKKDLWILPRGTNVRAILNARF